MSRKVQNKKPIIEEDSDHESNADSDIGSQIDDLDNDLEDPEALDEKDEEDDENENEIDDENSGYIKRIAQQNLLKENSEVIIVEPYERISSEYMTEYEYSMVIGTRATHISKGAPIYVDITGISDARDIAIKEINEKKCPLSVRRKLPNRKIEIWEVNEMTKPML